MERLRPVVTWVNGPRLCCPGLLPWDPPWDVESLKELEPPAAAEALVGFPLRSELLVVLEGASVLVKVLGKVFVLDLAVPPKAQPAAYLQHGLAVGCAACRLCTCTKASNALVTKHFKNPKQQGTNHACLGRTQSGRPPNRTSPLCTEYFSPPWFCGPIRTPGPTSPAPSARAVHQRARAQAVCWRARDSE